MSLKQAVESLEAENADLRAQVAQLANDYSESLALLNVSQSAIAELKRNVEFEHDQWKQSSLASIEQNATVVRLEFENAALRGVIIEAMRGVVE